MPVTDVYAPRTPWGPYAATLATVGVVVVAVLMSLAPFAFLPQSGRADALSPGVILAAMTVTQMVLLLGGWWLAGLYGGDRRAVLALEPSRWSWRANLLAIIGMIAATSAYQAVRYYGLGHDVFTDMRAMAPLFRGWIWPLSFVVVSFLAPIAEEVLFRGFLQSAFSRSRTLFWLGVTVATVIWTTLHQQYGLPSLGLVAMMGVIFSLMLRASGSLRLPILAHGVNNTMASLYVLLFFQT